MRKMSFTCTDFKRVELEDAKILIPYLTNSRESSCEYNYSNLYTWGHTYDTRYTLYNGHPYIHLVNEDMLLFASCMTCEEPSSADIIAVSDGMRYCGFEGTFDHIRHDFLDAHTDLLEHFDAVETDDKFDEYVYSVKSLFELHGSKLAKKRNLISQFERDFPDYEVRDLTRENIADAIEMADLWRDSHPEHDRIEIMHESEAIHHLTDDFDTLDMAGCGIYVAGRMVSFALWSRISQEMFTEPFEKALFDYKGAAQVVNHEMAKRLFAAGVKYVNREQDLGDPGLRQAKMSYMPEFKLKDLRLIRKS